ncbi:conserved protein of unknown function [Candidatus Hydrogenisulfobacillus filiaventi]|uniref:DUF2508 domain-containing protein n=1 Tax=Candidatus Hydrogenisulfobacillus filiaventi TaxID=2707344 RepID=A0A6F8ZIA4_9FIRM|nr:hypothetical protein [Bacillota bacterium]CAB1129609.1 conserved protein of unknown function [Candidatus Hydrogenisulfobacillus filiaventi]
MAVRKIRESGDREGWQAAIQAAVREVREMEDAFNQAERETCDYQIYRLRAAEEHLALVLRQARRALGADPAVARLAPPPPRALPYASEPPADD